MIQTDNKDLYGDSGVLTGLWDYNIIEDDRILKLFRIRYVPFALSNGSKDPLLDKGVWFSPHTSDYPYSSDNKLLTDKGKNHLIAYIEALLVSSKYNPIAGQGKDLTEEQQSYAQSNPFYGLNPHIV
jgi:hypothetical protein